MQQKKILTIAAAVALVSAGLWMVSSRSGRESAGAPPGEGATPRALKPQAGGFTAPPATTRSDSMPPGKGTAATGEAGERAAAAAKRNAEAGVAPLPDSEQAMRGDSRLERTAERKHEPPDSAHDFTDALDSPGVPSPPPPGLRLADDVRLPAAAMPHDMKLTPVAEKMLQMIVDDYYRDLAAGLAHEMEALANGEQVADGTPVETGPQGEKTLVVTNGELAEQARKRADARFKAIFGYAAYNRVTMQSAIESRLPASGR